MVRVMVYNVLSILCLSFVLLVNIVYFFVIFLKYKAKHAFLTIISLLKISLLIAVCVLQIFAFNSFTITLFWVFFQFFWLLLIFFALFYDTHITTGASLLFFASGSFGFAILVNIDQLNDFTLLIMSIMFLFLLLPSVFAYLSLFYIVITKKEYASKVIEFCTINILFAMGTYFSIFSTLAEIPIFLVFSSLFYFLSASLLAYHLWFNKFRRIT